MKLLLLAVTICIFLCAVTKTDAEDFELTVLHTNDVHAHIEQFNTYGGTCQPEHAKNNECFGGVARRHTVITDIRNKNPNTILIDGGDQFAGTLWFTVYKGEAALRFMNYTKYQAMVRLYTARTQRRNGTAATLVFIAFISGPFEPFKKHFFFLE